MWRRCGFLLGRSLDDTNAGYALRAVRRVERRRVAKAQARRATEGTNPYNKAQYINAFVEAESARMTHERLMHEGAAEEQSLLAVVNAARPAVAMAPDKHVLPGTTGPGAVAFGAWREADPALERACLSADRNLHCIVRGATTPPAFSPEALQRGMPARLESVQRLLRLLHASGRRRWPRARLSAFAACMESSLDAACGEDFSTRQRVMAVLLHSAAARNWELALQLYQSLLLPCLQQQRRRLGRGEEAVTGTDATTAAASTLVAVLCESIRAHHHAGSPARGSGPSFNTLAGLLHPSSPPLLPVAAAPLFSILQPSDGATWQKAVALAQRFQPRGATRMYLPAIAWGELLRAMHRMGASLAEVQGVVDIITDPSRTKNADKHMRDTHIWNAYISVSDWRHALEVYSSNLPYYGVKETAATSAALMESLLRDKQWEQALDVFRRLQRKEGQLIIGTSGVFTAVFRALEQQGDWQAVAALLMDFDHFLAHFGVPHDFWLASPLREALMSPQQISEGQLVARVRELPGCSYVSSELALAVESALVACNRRKPQQQQQRRRRKQHSRHPEPEAPAGAEDVCDDAITAERLHDLM
ncbi:oxidoreductase [Trypanosoma conorhini]|uniref:Oxidoreductase n=1 Tax=Trypanosoma conorhini TaxID=83891 RepID=A0A3R7PY67_9TRYP|nr:oxidoreductase [Trypanosoma conorhini]RNF27075.1 oxidoreductase [Trypanosoma conorhini]